MTILFGFLSFCYVMLYNFEMGKQFLIMGLALLVGALIDLAIIRIDGYIQRKRIMKKIRKNRKQGLTKTTPSAIIKSQKRGNKPQTMSIDEALKNFKFIAGYFNSDLEQ